MIFEGVDLFCGAGGVTTGINQAAHQGQPIARVVAAVNHDPLAIKSHADNHPETHHFTEDIRRFDVRKLPEFKNRKSKRIFLWASLECTNFSNAKGGLPRDADSRTLAEHLFRYIERINPDYIIIENVREFMAWGPLDGNGKPLSRKNGRDYLKWIQNVCACGYDYDWRLLNAADYGAYTSRIRYFGIFARKGLPIRFPKPTHAKHPEKTGLNLKKWKAVRDVLDLGSEGQSIFTRRKPLVDRTLKRILAGLERYVINSEAEWLLKGHSSHNNTKVNAGASTKNPSPTLTTQNRLHLGRVEFLQSYYGSGSHNHRSIKRPAGTVTTKDRMSKVSVDQLRESCRFLSKAYSGSPDSMNNSLDKPAGTVTTVDHHQLVSANWLDWNYPGDHHHQELCRPCRTITTVPCCRLVAAQWLDKQYNSPHNHQSTESPAGALTVNPKLALVSAPQFLMPTNYSNTPTSLETPAGVLTAGRKWHYLVNPQFQSPAKDVDSPCFTLIARMDKKPPALITTEEGYLAIKIEDSDSDVMKDIKRFMAAHGIVDIKMRMLNIGELKRITGLETSYILHGTKADQKKFIGNAVPVVVPKAIFEALYQANAGIKADDEYDDLPLMKCV